jgi:hypothetical protein
VIRIALKQRDVPFKGELESGFGLTQIILSIDIIHLEIEFITHIPKPWGIVLYRVCQKYPN